MDNPKHHLNKAGYYALCFLICSQFFGIGTIYAGVLFFREILSDSAIIAAANIVQYLGALPFCMMVLKGLPNLHFARRNLSFSELFGCFCLCALFSQIGYIIGAYCAGGISYILGTGVTDILNEQINTLGMIENFIVLVLAAPVLEELIFRKILLDKTAGKNRNTAVFLSAFLFGLIHCNVYQFFYAFFIGIILGIVYTKSGRIGYCIMLHSAFNLFFGFVPSIISAESQVGKTLLTALAIVQYALLFYGIAYLFKSAKKHITFLKDFFSEINANLSVAMLNHGVIITVIITTVIYITGLFE